MLQFAQMVVIFEVPVHGAPMRICVGEPEGRGPHAAILLAFHPHGYSPFIADVVAQFSAAGYLIAVPDLYHRCGDVSADEAVKHRRDDHVLADMAAGLRYLKNRPDVDRDRLIVAGHCMGGRIAFLVASTWPDTFKACLSYYSGGMFLPWGGATSPFDLLDAAIIAVNLVWNFYVPELGFDPVDLRRGWIVVLITEEACNRTTDRPVTATWPRGRNIAKRRRLIPGVVVSFSWSAGLIKHGQAMAHAINAQTKFSSLC